MAFSACDDLGRHARTNTRAMLRRNPRVGRPPGHGTNRDTGNGVQSPVELSTRWERAAMKEF